MRLRYGQIPQLTQASRAGARGNPNVGGKAVRAVQVATEHAEREGIRAGEGVKEGLLLDRVALERPHVAARDHQRAPAVVANLADAPKPLLDQAAVRARVAANLFVRQLFV